VWKFLLHETCSTIGELSYLLQYQYKPQREQPCQKSDVYNLFRPQSICEMWAYCRYQSELTNLCIIEITENVCWFDIQGSLKMASALQLNAQKHDVIREAQLILGLLEEHHVLVLAFLYFSFKVEKLFALTVLYVFLRVC
jgi:hypothetical protein